MTRDKILNTTVEFIRASERRLELAFQVEKALPEVRSELIKEFFECVEKQLVETTEEWEIRATGTDEGFCMRKKSWDRLKVRGLSEDWMGICLSSDEQYYPYISVENIKKTPKHVKEQIRKKFCKIDEPDDDEQHMWVYLTDDIEDFLKKMTNEEERREIVKDKTKKLLELVRAVDGVLSNSG